MLPKDDQEMEELMLEEVEVFKVGQSTTPGLLRSCQPTSVPPPDLRPPGQDRKGVPGSHANAYCLLGPSAC